MSVSSYESEPPHSPASITTSLTSTESVESPTSESPMSPDREFSQNFPLSEERCYQPDNAVPTNKEEAGFRGRKDLPTIQGPVPIQTPPLVADPEVDDPAPIEPGENPNLEEIRNLHIQTQVGQRRGAGRPVAMGDPLPAPPRTPPPPPAVPVEP